MQSILSHLFAILKAVFFSHAATALILFVCYKFVIILAVQIFVRLVFTSLENSACNISLKLVAWGISENYSPYHVYDVNYTELLQRRARL